jgi:hypothetical protein
MDKSKSEGRGSRRFIGDLEDGASALSNSFDAGFLREDFMHFHVRIHHWVLWWFVVGVVLGGVALINILFRDLSRTQERIILIIGALNWLTGGVICYGFEGVQIEKPHAPAKGDASPARNIEGRSQKEWHAASDFVLAGNHKGFLPPKY